ncbi:hypothetical protein BD770DRAFT_414502 [Pilaira anomala]|nr:hypothetical protein BD770DRAFT_414502 [Pilaira anomala]
MYEKIISLYKSNLIVHLLEPIEFNSTIICNHICIVLLHTLTNRYILYGNRLEFSEHKFKREVSRNLVSHKRTFTKDFTFLFIFFFLVQALSRVLKAFLVLVLVLVLGLGRGLGLQCIVNRAQVDFTSYFQSRLLGPDVFPPSRGCCPLTQGNI